MGKDVLVILMVAFGLFAILMFILFYVYLRKYYNNRHISDDYQKEMDNDIEEENYSEEFEEKEAISFEKEYANIKAVPISKDNNDVKEQFDMEMDFVPKKKK